ncbi:mucin-5AC [Danio aesculapii]|uniref:mucin-5AC n=1 Tax=Danio aesculapii TaxID=1142201 RepID=UPI0024C03E01|nr:mucin-5AC [Danio aesculapii]
MRHFVYLFLFICLPGNTLLNLSQDCGGKVLGEHSGSVRYSLHPSRPLFDRITNDSKEKQLDITCTWIIDAHENQTVWIDVISVGKGARIGIAFGNGDTVFYEKEEQEIFSGTGRTVVEWSLKRTDKTFATLHLRWNTSEENQTSVLIPYTHSEADPVSPSPSPSSDVTYTPDIPVNSNETPKTHTVEGRSTRQGGGVSDLADKHRPLYPQETTNNGQETAGVWISDLAFTGTHSYSDTHTSSGLDAHKDTLEVLSDEPSLAQSSTKNQSPLLSAQTTLRSATPNAANTTTLLETNDVAFTKLHRGSSQPTHTYAFTEIQSKTAKRGDLSSLFPTSSYMTVSPRNIEPFNQTSTQTDFISDIATKDKPTTRTGLNRDVFTISEKIGTTQFHQAFWSSNTITGDSQSVPSESDRTDRSSRSTNPNQTINEDLVMTTSTLATVSRFPNQTKPFPDSDMTEYSGYSASPPINVTTHIEPTTSSSTLATSEALTTQNLHTVQSHHTSAQETSSASAPVFVLTSHNNNKISAFTTYSTTGLTPTESTSTPEVDEGFSTSRRDCLGLGCTSDLPSTMQREKEIPITSPPSSSASPQMIPNMTSDVSSNDHTTVRFENHTNVKQSDTTPSQVRNINTKSSMHTELYTSTPQYLQPSSKTTQSHVGFSDVTDINEMTSGQMESTSQSSTSATSSKTTLSISQFNTESSENPNGFTSSYHFTTPSVFQVSKTDHTIQPSTTDSMTTPHWETSQTSVVHTSSVTIPQMNPHTTTTETTSVRVHKQPQPSTFRPLQHTTTSSYISHTKARKIPTQTVSHSTASSFDKKWPHGRHYFIVEDQPVIFKEKTFQVLLQIFLEEDYVPSVRLLEVETFLRKVAGFQNQHVTWHSGPVLQTVVQFQTMQALSWLGRAESLLQEAELNPLPKKGLFVGGVRVKNITEGGLQTDACEWLLECPSGFQCVSSKGNATCTSVCHSEYCKHQGICVHRLGQQPICQCPVGEDYWFMGQRCDLRMTRPRLVGVCFGVLVAVAAVMALLSYLAVRRFKRMLMQAKVEQTRSSYCRFNHFDELSARFWGRSWPGSEDSLDNPGFTRSDELLHLRALDRTCCYHDDTLSVVSTYHGSRAHLNTVYPHGSQYGWDLSNCSLADGVVDSGKASDLSVCSWPIEPIQWTPFPLLQQLSRNTTTVKASRPRSYCEGMELVDLEKSWTA